MLAFDHEALWAKSVLFIKRGLRERDARDYAGFQLWGAVALELLGKAALARVHPALVVDPTHAESLFAACGRPAGVERRTITAKTLFERLRRLNPRFDKQAQDFSLTLAIRRNGELHSGEAVYAGIKLESWVKHYWKVAALVLETQARGLADWIGEEEAKAAQEVIDEAMTALKQAIDGRVRTQREKFDKQFPPGSPERAELVARHKGGALVRWRDFQPYGWDHHIAIECPACKCDGMLAGPSIGEEKVELEFDEGEEPWTELFDITCSSEAYRCRACDLKLDGLDEIEAAEIDSEFEVQEEREPEYEEEYANE